MSTFHCNPHVYITKTDAPSLLRKLTCSCDEKVRVRTNEAVPSRDDASVGTPDPVESFSKEEEEDVEEESRETTMTKYFYSS